MFTRQFLQLVILAAVWGASFLFMRVAVPEFGPFALIAVRVSIASMVLIPIWYWRESARSASSLRSHWRQLAVVGVLNSAIPFVLFAYATLTITGGLASILNSTASIWTVVVAWVWLNRKPTSQTVFGLALGFVGVIILVSDSMVGTAGFDRGVGALAAALAAVTYGIAANYTAEKLVGVSTLTTATFSLVAASVLLIPLAIVFTPETTISTQAWAAVIAMGVVSTAIANIIYFNLLRSIGPTRTVTVAFMIPVFGTLWGALFIDEQITAGMLFGGLVILFGIALVTHVVRLPSLGSRTLP